MYRGPIHNHNLGSVVSLRNAWNTLYDIDMEGSRSLFVSKHDDFAVKKTDNFKLMYNPVFH